MKILKYIKKNRDFIVVALNAYWNEANGMLQKTDLGDIERKSYEHQSGRSKKLMEYLLELPNDENSNESWSRDYEWLYELLKNDDTIQVVGLVDYLYDKNSPQKGGCRDVVSVKLSGKYIEFGSRGIGYSPWHTGKQAFCDYAKSYNLEFIKSPSNRQIAL